MHELTWGMPVIIYLFAAGLGAGALTTSASMLLRGGPPCKYYDIARYGAIIAPITVAFGSALLVFETGSFQAGDWFRFLNLYKVINLSPMSIGTWLLTVFLIISVVYAATFLDFVPMADELRHKARRFCAWTGIPLGIGVAVYTGVLLGAMPARPFWNSPILAMLFFLSALSTGMASINLLRAINCRVDLGSKEGESYNEGGYILAATDTIMIGLELLTIFLFLMYAHLTIGHTKEAVQIIMPGGELSGMFWFWVVTIGLLVPAALELFMMFPHMLGKLGYTCHRRMDIIVSIAVLIGGFMLRYVVVVAGQVTHPIGL